MTTFEQFFKENPDQKEIYDKEYNDFLLSEFMLEQMEAQNISVRELAKKADVSPTVIQKLRSKDAQKVNLTTFTSVLKSLGYQIKLEKVPSLRQNYLRLELRMPALRVGVLSTSWYQGSVFPCRNPKDNYFSLTLILSLYT